MNKRIERQIEKIYRSVFKKVFDNRTLKKTEELNNKTLIKRITNLKNSRTYAKFAEKFAKELAREGLANQRGLWKKYFEAARKLEHGTYHKTYTEFQKAQFTKAIEHNFKMIKSIPDYVLNVYKQKYIKTLKAQVLKGEVGRKTFEAELKKQGATNAKLIARTETAKLQTAIMENRAQDLGSVAYIWLSSNDMRTRKSHKNMNGVVVFWRKKDEEKPNLDDMFGNAGEFPNCRCSPEPILDENDITKSIYRVYDYRTKKIIQLTRRQLINSLNKNEITKGGNENG